MAKRAQKRFKYMLKTEGEPKPYSGAFISLEEAREWYNTKGKMLEKMFNRKLELRIADPREEDWVYPNEDVAKPG